MNVVILQGRLTDDPIVKDYGSFKTAEFTIAVRRNYKNRQGEYDTDFIKCRSNRSVDYIQQYFHKGDAMSVYGRWRIDVYDDKDGNRNWYNCCDVDNVGFALTNRPKDSQSYNSNYNQSSVEQPRPVFQEPSTNIIPNKSNTSSWQKPVNQNSDPFASSQPVEQPNKESIPQAFDIPMDDEFLPTDGFLF